MLIAAPTSPDLVADTNHYNAYDFMIHDVGHFRAFSSSAYAFRRTLGRLNPILNKIDSQRNPAERLKDHLALFFLVHEFPPSGFGSTSYMETVEDVVRTGVSVLTSDKTYQFFRFEEFVPLFKEVLPSQDYIEGDNKHNFLALCHAFADKYAPFQTVDESVNKKRSLEDINTDLEKGLKYATDAVALREKIARRGQDYNKNNIPELESQLPEIKTNFENATQDKTRRQTFYKVLQLIKKDFARKKVTLPRWSNFLAWVNYVAYEYIYPGMKLELGSEWSLPSFIFYFPETSMSAKASNFARVHNLKPIFFSRSSFNPRFITNENGLADAVAFYDQIDTNRDLVTRAENHLALHVLFERKALEMEGLKKNIRVAKLKEASDWLMSHLLLSRLDLKDLIFAHFARGDVELDKIADDQFRVTTFGDNGKQNRVDIVTLKKNTPNEITFEYDFKGRKEVVSSAFQPLDHFDVEALNLIRHLGYEPSGENLTGIMKHLLDGLISESEKTP